MTSKGILGQFQFQRGQDDCRRQRDCRRTYSRIYVIDLYCITDQELLRPASTVVIGGSIPSGSHHLLADLDPTLVQQIPDVPLRQREANVRHVCSTRDLRAGSKHSWAVSGRATRLREGPLPVPLAAISCRRSIQCDRLRSHPCHRLSFGPFAAQRGQATVHQGHVVEH